MDRDLDPPFAGDPAWRVTRVLADGTEITIRPVVPSDRDELRRAFRDASPRTKYLRFLAVVGELSDAMLTYLTCVDQKDHVALVATVPSPDLKVERGIGIARFIKVSDGIAEAAITVADDWQKRGVGTALARELAGAARARDIHVLRAEVLENNAMMRSILESAGAYATNTSDGIVSYDVRLDPSTMMERLRHVMRGAAQTMAVTIRQLAPPTTDGDEAERAERERE